jgi:hypothetical protein
VNRLQQRWPEANSAVSALPSAEQALLARRVATAALDATGQSASAADDRLAMTDETQRLDEIAWALQEQIDSGLATRSAYEEAFQRVRAMNAALLANQGGDPSEAIYEALHALPPNTDIRGLARS